MSRGDLAINYLSAMLCDVSKIDRNGLIQKFLALKVLCPASGGSPPNEHTKEKCVDGTGEALWLARPGDARKTHSFPVQPPRLALYRAAYIGVILMSATMSHKRKMVLVC